VGVHDISWDLLAVTLRYFPLSAVHDSNAKLGSGLLSGNVNQYGDYHECLSARPDDGSLKPRYCLSWMQLYLSDAEPVDPVIRKIHDLIYSHHAFRSNFEDVSSWAPLLTISTEITLNRSEASGT